MEDNLLQAVKERRSIRKYSGKPVEVVKLEQLVEFASWAPSSCNRRATFFIVVTDQDLKAKISNKKNVLESYATIVVLVDLSKYSVLKNNLAPYLDAGVAIQNMLLGAHSLGLACCLMAGRLDEELIKSVLKIPKSYIITALISVGYSGHTHPLKPPEREPAKRMFSINYYKRNSYTGYKSIIRDREKWSRAGWDIRCHYDKPREGTRIFDYARWKLNALLSNGLEDKDKILLTFSAFGYLLKGLESKNYECLVTSEDEREFIISYLAPEEKNFEEDSLILLSPLELNLLSNKYKYIVSFFDIPFMKRNEIKLFFKRALNRLEGNGELIAIFFNSDSLFGLNYKLSRLFKRTPEFIREIGFEYPLKIREILNLIPGEGVTVCVKTSMFIPPINIGYLFEDMGRFFIKRGMGRLDWLQSLPVVKKLGNIVFLSISNEISNDKR